MPKVSERITKQSKENSERYTIFVNIAEMLLFWRKKDKEMAEIKRKKDKVEKEMKKKEEEQREALLQKKRLEFLMSQSVIYSHFMAKKLGIAGEEPPVEKEKEKDETQIFKIDTQSNQSLDPEVEIDQNEVQKSVTNMINEQRDTLRKFDEESQKIRVMRGGPAGVVSDLGTCNENELNHNDENAEMIDENRYDSPSINTTKVVEAPKGFQGELKVYQLKGLRWLDNLYDQGINGILADEMGLGKTIQAISLLAHLSENRGNWGPFLIIAPSTTLFNWQQEINRFSPSLKVLPYWGTQNERKTLRKYFNQKLLYTPSSPFHVLVTSYQLIVADEKFFHRVKWQYMILDEAQAIKNINSQRWKV